MIIGINGYSGSGKDTVGTIIQYLKADASKDIYLEDVLDFPISHEWWLSERSNWEIKKWAGKLKVIANMLTGIPIEKFEDQEFKKTELGSEWNRQFYTEGKGWEHRPMLVREFLQFLGTDGLRTGLHENTWVNALMADYIPTQVQWADGPLGGYEDGPLPNWIITDTRFPNEADAIKKAGGIVIRVQRPGVEPINNHPSEVSLDDYNFDHVINNSGNLQDLSDKVKLILEKEQIM